MSDTVTINRSAFVATPMKGKGAIDMLRRLQSQLRDSAEPLNDAQKVFVNEAGHPENNPTAIARKLGWLSMPPVILEGDSLTADETGITLKQGKTKTKRAYSEFLSLPKQEQATSSKDEFVIVIDAGHGGHDSGATYPPNLKDGDPKIQIKEEDVTLAIAKKVKQKMQGKTGIKILMTREEDKYLTLDERVEFSDNNGADLFVSIHANASPNEKARGYQVFTQKPEAYKESEFFKQRPRIARSTIAKEFINAYLSARISRGNRSTNTPEANFQVTREPEAPAVLIEAGFTSNAYDRALLQSEEHQDLIATQICSALDHMFRGPVKD